LALVGLPGCGKSTMGRLLGRELDRPFWDLDRAIEERLGCTIAEYFAKAGEARFREVESQVLDELTQIDLGVLSTGGGSVLKALNRQRLRERCQVIYLHATPIQLFPRLRHDKKRPLLQVADPLQKLVELFDARDPLYRQTAHQVISSGGRPARWVLEQCLQQVGHNAHPQHPA